MPGMGGRFVRVGGFSLHVKSCSANNNVVFPSRHWQK